MIGLLAGTHTLLVGVEDDPSGALRCYLGSRHKGLYVLVDGEEDKAKVRHAWASSRDHVTFPIPPGRVHLERTGRGCCFSRRGFTMKVRAGTLSDEERAMIVESNRTGRRISVHTAHGCHLRSQHGAHGCFEHDCMVGTVTGWDHESFQIGGWSFEVNIPWESARHVWWRDEYPRDADGRERCPVDTCASNLRAMAKAA